MEKLIHEDSLGSFFTVFWDDLQIDRIESIERSVFYKCTGYDALGREYEGISEYCCGEFEGITEVERITHMHRNKKPYQARVLLKSIRYWQSIINGEVEPKRPLAYYENKLKYYHKSDIDYLVKLAT